MSITAAREEFLSDIITTAIEGGTGYWAEVHAYKWMDRPPAQVYAVIRPLDEAATVRLTINPDLIAEGITRIKSGEVKIRHDLKVAIWAGESQNDAGDIDADCADCIVQAGLFGEVRYG